MLHTAQQVLTRIHARVFGSNAQQQRQPSISQGPGNHHQQQQEQQEQSQNLPGIRRVVRRVQQQQQQPGAIPSGGSAATQELHNDVRLCLQAERRDVLQGCRIVFSRCASIIMP